jgi:hypothetical protein
MTGARDCRGTGSALRVVVRATSGSGMEFHHSIRVKPVSENQHTYVCGVYELTKKADMNSNETSMIITLVVVSQAACNCLMRAARPLCMSGVFSFSMPTVMRTAAGTLPVRSARLHSRNWL